MLKAITSGQQTADTGNPGSDNIECSPYAINFISEFLQGFGTPLLSGWHHLEPMYPQTYVHIALH